MAFNNQHAETFTALLQLWGLPLELARRISCELANIDNTRQDELIEFFTVELQRKHSSSESSK